MQLHEQFNNLNGVEVDRKTLEIMLKQADAEGNYIISKRVAKILHEYNDDRFLVEIINLVEPFGLNGEHQSDIIEMLNGLDYIPESEDIGLGRAVSSTEIYDMVTYKMIDLIEKANNGDYKRAWKDEGYVVPYNFVSKKAYRGINTILLVPPFLMLDNPYFLTFKQVKQLGGKVKKGSNGHKIIYYSSFEKDNDDENNTDEKEKFYFIKYYNVFNGADIEDIDFDLDNFSLMGKVSSEIITTGKNENIAIADAIIQNYPLPKPQINFEGSSASYFPSKDIIKMPDINKFISSQDFYRTFFHEISHSTGVLKRLNRPMNNVFGSKGYAFEELVAEFGAVFLTAQAGILFYNNKNHAAYLKNWNDRLLVNLKNDNRFLIKASSAAQKLSDFILQPDEQGNYLFLKDFQIKKDTKKIVKKNTIKQKLDVKKVIIRQDLSTKKTAFVKAQTSDIKVRDKKIMKKSIVEANPIQKKTETTANNILDIKDLKQLYPFVSKDKLRQNLSNVFFENGNAIATDGHVLTQIKANYLSEYEGKILNINVKQNYLKTNKEISFLEYEKKHQFVNESFAQYKNVIQNYKNVAIIDVETLKKEIDELLKLRKFHLFVQNGIAKGKFIAIYSDKEYFVVDAITKEIIFKSENEINTYFSYALKINDAYFNILFLEKICKLLSFLKITLVSISTNGANMAMEVKSKNVYFLLMPIILRDVENKSYNKIFSINTNKAENKTLGGLSKSMPELFDTSASSDQIGLFGGIKISTDAFKKMSVTELRAFTLKYYNSNLKGKKLAIKKVLKTVEFTSGAGKKIAKGGTMYKEKTAVVEKLETIIKNSTYNNWGNRKVTDSEDILGYLNFKSKIVIDGEKKHVRVAIVLTKKRETRLKNVDIGQKKNPLSSGRSALPADGESEFKNIPVATKGTSQSDLAYRNTFKNKETKTIPKNQIENENNFLARPATLKTRTKSVAEQMANRSRTVVNFTVQNPEISEFLGKIERKTKESVVVTLTGGEGSMKTRMAFQFINAFAQNHLVGHASIEEHPESGLYFDKAEQYLNAQAMANTTAPEIRSMNDLHQLIIKNDVIVIDSFQKMRELYKGFEVDKDLRKKYDGKLFFIIFQQTTDGKMRGGSTSQFDADVVLFTEKFDDYTNNYIYASKNRYQKVNLSELKFNVFEGKIIRSDAETIDIDHEVIQTTAQPLPAQRLSFVVY